MDRVQFQFKRVNNPGTSETVQTSRQIPFVDRAETATNYTRLRYYCGQIPHKKCSIYYINNYRAVLKAYFVRNVQRRLLDTEHSHKRIVCNDANALLMTM